MQPRSDVHRLHTANLIEKVNLTNCSYVGKLLVSGPDAAIEVVGDRLSQFMLGSPSANPAFQKVIDDEREAIFEAARKLRVEPSDRIIFTGVWFHVDYEREPWFEGYVIHVVSADGIVHTHPYDCGIFDQDNSEKGHFRIAKFDASSRSHLVDRLLATAINMAGESSVSTSGIPRLQGVVWYPTDDNLPIVVSKLIDITKSDRLPEDIDALKPDLASAQREFLDAHAEALASDAITERLSTAFAKVYQMSRKMKKWALRELQFSKFGARADEIVVRHRSVGSITLSDLANSGNVEGYWFQVRNNEEIIQGAAFKRFDDDARAGLNDYRAVFKKQPQEFQSEDGLHCELASDWAPTRAGSSVRFLAAGQEPRLSW